MTLPVIVLFLAFFTSSEAACNIKWPNGTDTRSNFWECDQNPVRFSNFRTYDLRGNPMYPIRVDQTIVLRVDMNNPGYTLQSPNLRVSSKIWAWGGAKGCGWHQLPTFGLMDNLDACSNGYPCPILPGKRTITVTQNLAKFSAILKLLFGDTAYQIQWTLTDSFYKTSACVIGQLRIKQ